MTDEQKLTGQLLVNNSNSCSAETADQKQTFKAIPNWPSGPLGFDLRRVGLRPNALCRPIVIIFA